MKVINGLFTLMFVVSTSLAMATENAKTDQKTAPVVSAPGPHKVVEEVTSELMSVVNEGKDTLTSDPQKFFSEIRTVMETAVDFEYIAKNVMGAKHWRGASEQQKSEFVEVFTSGLVATYAKGMANFANFDISVQAPAEAVGERRKVEVIQQFKGPNGVNKVSYTMGKNKAGDWKLINVVLDGVNLGKSLRAQFAQSVNESKGDLAKAIAGWTWES